MCIVVRFSISPYQFKCLIFSALRLASCYSHFNLGSRSTRAHRSNLLAIHLELSIVAVGYLLCLRGGVHCFCRLRWWFSTACIYGCPLLPLFRLFSICPALLPCWCCPLSVAIRPVTGGIFSAFARWPYGHFSATFWKACGT